MERGQGLDNCAASISGEWRAGEVALFAARQEAQGSSLMGRAGGADPQQATAAQQQQGPSSPCTLSTVSSSSA